MSRQVQPVRVRRNVYAWQTCNAGKGCARTRYKSEGRSYDGIRKENQSVLRRRGRRYNGLREGEKERGRAVEVERWAAASWLRDSDRDSFVTGIGIWPRRGRRTRSNHYVKSRTVAEKRRWRERKDRPTRHLAGRNYAADPSSPSGRSPLARSLLCCNTENYPLSRSLALPLSRSSDIDKVYL